MKNLKNTLLLLVLICLSLSSVEAQLFNRLKKRTMDKLERKAEDKLVEALAEEIARRAFKPIDKAMDDMLKSTYEEEYKKGNEGEEVDWEKVGSSYSDFLSGMNKAADVPASYTFDIIMDIEIKDGEKEKHEVQYFFSTAEGIMGMKQFEDKEENFMVFDVDRDVIVIYTEEDGKKKAQALPSMMKMAGAFAANENESKNPKVEKTGKTKKIAGYECDEYKIESEEDKIKAYVAQEFPITMKKTFGGMLAQFVPENYKKATDLMEGMMLESEYESKENKKYNSTWKTKKVEEKKTIIDNKKYGLEPKL